MWISAFFIKLLYYVLDKHLIWCLLSLLFKSGYFLKWLSFIHLYLHNSEWISLLRMCTLKFCLYDIIWEGVLEACSHQFEEAVFEIGLHLAFARFIWWPKFLYWKTESANWCLSLSPSDNLWCLTVPLSPSCSPFTAYFSFNLGWGVRPAQSLHLGIFAPVILDALLWSFSICIVPLFLRFRGTTSPSI